MLISCPYCYKNHLVPVYIHGKKALLDSKDDYNVHSCNLKDIKKK